MVARLEAVWQAREELAALADESQSWEQVVERLKQFPWYGGSGFHAKEAVQDMLNTVSTERVMAGVLICCYRLFSSDRMAIDGLRSARTHTPSVL